MQDGTLRFCSIEGCGKITNGGPCHRHRKQAYERAYKRTSDGVRGSRRKLTAEQCKAIKKRSSQFATQKEIATEFGVTINVIRHVLKGTYTPRED